MDALSLIEKYYKKGTPQYDILVRHSVAVQQKALACIAQHPELNCDVEFVSEAAMLHDIGIYLTSAPALHCSGSHSYIEHGYLGAELLRKEGYPRHALVCERHTGTGLSLEQIEEQNMPLPHRDMRPVSTEEQLICFADKFYSKTHIDEEFTIDQVRNKLSKFGEKSVAQFDSWLQIFG